MKIYPFLLLLAIGCAPGKKEVKAPPSVSEIFEQQLKPSGLIAHAGIFSVDQSQFYLTLSDIEYQLFTVVYSEIIDGVWSDPKEAFFNSEYNEHGVHFSPDGEWLYFSSTRPINDTVPETWHIWRCRRQEDTWSEPEYIHFPGFEEKLTSHPSQTNKGRLYFHSGNSDYSDLALYYSDNIDDSFTEPKEVLLPNNMAKSALTAFIAPDESYLLFTRHIGEDEETFISYKNEDNTWTESQKLNSDINTGNLGNPYVTNDGQTLFFAALNSADSSATNWVIKSIPMSSILE